MKNLLLIVALFTTMLHFSAHTQGVGIGYWQTNEQVYTIGLQTADRARFATWVTEWSATATKDGISGLSASIGPRYKIGGFELGASATLLMPLFAGGESDQTTRLYFSPVLGVRNGPATVFLSFMPQVFPLEKKAYALRVGAAYAIKKPH